MDDMKPPQEEDPQLVARAAAGDRAAVAKLLEQYRGRLRRMVALRLDPRLQGRVDASDVIQEGYIDAVRRLDEFVRDPAVPFYIWLRFLVGQRLQEQHRRHLDTPGRDVGREIRRPARHAGRQHRCVGRATAGQADQPQRRGDPGRG